MPRALLAVLLLRANGVVPSDRLVEELWAGEPPASGIKGLRVHVSRLRRSLAAARSDSAEERLVTTAGGYLLRVGPDELDADRSECLIAEGRSLVAAGEMEQALAAFCAALELWRGPILSDFQYDAFAQADIARLGALRAIVLEERIAVEVILGRETRVLGELESLVQGVPISRTAARSADARSVPSWTAGRRAGGLPRGPVRAGRRARDRALRRAAAAARSDPRPGPGAARERFSSVEGDRRGGWDERCLPDPGGTPSRASAGACDSARRPTAGAHRADRAR